jgi:hypothetical protein
MIYADQLDDCAALVTTLLGDDRTSTSDFLAVEQGWELGQHRLAALVDCRRDNQTVLAAQRHRVPRLRFGRFA